MKNHHLGSVRWVLPQGLPGLPPLTELDIRVLPPEMLYGLVNRLVRFEFPASRDYEATLQLVSKGVLNPVASGKGLIQLPFCTLQQLALQVIGVSLSQKLREEHQLSGLDILLSAALTIESLQQFNAEAICSEDRALINQHMAPSSWGGPLSQDMTRETLVTFLEEQCLRGEHFNWDQISGLMPPQAYWIDRKLGMVLPWESLLAQCPEAILNTYPRLRRAKTLLQALASMSSGSVASLIQETLPPVYESLEIRPPYQRVILVEGSTEALLLPVLFQALLPASQAQAIRVMPVGGKNQMLEHYVTLSEQLVIPIGVVLDRDAKSMEADLVYYQRPEDTIVILDEGEFEDLYAPEAIAQIVNTHYQSFDQVSSEDLVLLPGQFRSRQLARLWPALGLGAFEKVTLAHQMADVILQGQGVTNAMRRLVCRLTGHQSS